MRLPSLLRIRCRHLRLLKFRVMGLLLMLHTISLIDIISYSFDNYFTVIWCRWHNLFILLDKISNIFAAAIAITTITVLLYLSLICFISISCGTALSPISAPIFSYYLFILILTIFNLIRLYVWDIWIFNDFLPPQRRIASELLRYIAAN